MLQRHETTWTSSRAAKKKGKGLLRIKKGLLRIKKQDLGSLSAFPKAHVTL